MQSMVAAAIAACRGAGRRHALTVALVAILALSPAVAWTLPARAQDEPAAPAGVAPLVIAQGIGRLPRGELLWTVRRVDVPGGDGAAIEAFPLGFVVADGGAIALQNDDDDVIALLDGGEAVFLPSGRGGALVSRGAEPAGAFEIALVSRRQAEGGDIAGNAAGGPFAAPDGAAFDLELARGILTTGDEAVIPAARSGAPVLFLLTEGAAQLESGGQVADLGAGQFALLVGDVLVRGTGDAPASFVVAAIGEATGERADAAGTPEARAGRGDRQRVRGQGGGGGGGQQAAAGGQRAPREGRGGRGGRGGGGGRQGQPGAGGGTGGAPGAGGVEQPQVPGGTPPAETPIPIPATPDTDAPTDGTPTPEATLTPTPTGDVIEETPADDEPTEEVEEFPTPTPEPTIAAPEQVETPVGEETPAVVETPPAAEEPIAEEIAPPVEEPAAEPAAPVEPAAEAPIVEEPAPVEEPAAVETPAA